MFDPIQFCTACGKAVKLEQPADDNRVRPVCQTCFKVHYQNPNIVTGVVCFYQEKVLLCRRAIEPRCGFWTLPAGYMELNETAEQGALREAQEEAGVFPTDLSLLAVYSLPHISQVQILFLGHLSTPELEAGSESLEVRLFEWQDIPWDALAFPSNEQVLKYAKTMKDSPVVVPDTRGDFPPLKFETQ